jgi:hypothetical protein
MNLIKELINEGTPSEKTHEDRFLKVLDILNSLGFELDSKYKNYYKQPGNGFSATYKDDFFGQHRVEKMVVDALLKKGFKFGVPKSEKDALDWHLINNPVFIRMSKTRKGLYVYCERVA